jgi:hypothetical protein
MTRTETKLRNQGNAFFLKIERYRAEEADGKVSWTKSGHEDVNLSCEYGQFSLCRLVSDGILTPEEAADIRARLDAREAS